MTEPALEVENLKVAEHGEVFFQDLSFRLEMGQCGLLMAYPQKRGRRLMHACATMLEPTAGTIKWLGLPSGYLTDETYKLAIRRRVGWVHRETRMVSNMTVLDNITLGLMYHRNLPRPEAVAEVHDVIERFDFQDEQYLRPADLAYGRQRLAIYIRELAKAPRLLVLENPMTDLGDDFGPFWSLIQTWLANQQAAVLMSESLDRTVLSTSTWVLVMDENGHAFWPAGEFDPSWHLAHRRV